MVKKITVSDMIDRFGKRRVLRALTKRKFRNKRRAEERKTGQKNFGFKKGGQIEEGLLIMIEEKKKGGDARKKLGPGARLGAVGSGIRNKDLAPPTMRDRFKRRKEKKAGGGITGQSKLVDLKKKYGSMKKGIRVKGKGKSFMEQYKKRVYGRAGGGSMVQGPMKRARGSGAAIKGTKFQGTF
jgi:hypothetical protein